jgi:hypothetical protein
MFDVFSLLFSVKIGPQNASNGIPREWAVLADARARPLRRFAPKRSRKT